MTKKQIVVLNELLRDPDFKGKRYVDWLIWFNTAKSKYKIGDFVKFSDNCRSIGGKRVINFNAKVIGVRASVLEEKWRYDLEFVCRFENKDDYKSKCFVYEDCVTSSDTDINYL